MSKNNIQAGKSTALMVAFLRATCTALAVTIFISCGRNSEGENSAERIEVPEEVTVGNAVLKMTNIAPTSFAMGLTPAGVKAGGATIHEVALSGYSISKAPVNQALYEAVMGSNPSSVQNPGYPVDMVTKKDCEKFAAKLTKITGIPFSLPTEAQWEWAIVSGQSQTPDKYTEWCSDSYTDELGSVQLVDPAVKAKSDVYVTRTPKQRLNKEYFVKAPGLSFHVVVNSKLPITDEVKAYFIDKTPPRENVCKKENFTVNGVSFKMLPVKGGSFTMGSDPSEDKYADDDEQPRHSVSISDFEIGETEVTAELWNAVMGYLPYRNSLQEGKKPVVNVSWYDCQRFILKLNAATGRKFRLPTEAEWEYAALGGQYSMGRDFAGGDYIMLVAAYNKNAASEVVRVKSYQPNELGTYDMSGNAWEWCQDSHTLYSSEPQTDPCPNEGGETRVMKGGSAASQWIACRVHNRQAIPASSLKSSFGFRLAL